MKKVIIASLNPVKIQTTKGGFTTLFPTEQFQFQGIDVPSNVSAQPIGEDEILAGAINRVQNASRQTPEADF